jgi:iron complex transport system permease protein
MTDDFLSRYKKYRGKKGFVFVLSGILLIVLAVISTVLGSADIRLNDIIGVLSGSEDSFTTQIVVHIRFPRILGAIISGAGLAVSGVVVQSLLRNPLASPFTLGISGASAFGAAFAIIILGAGSNYAGSGDAATITNPYIVTTSAFIFSLCSVAIILLLSKFKGASPETIILAGIIVSSLFGAGISALQYFSDNVQLASIVFWTFGDIGRATIKNCLIIITVITPCIIFFFYNSWNYKSLLSGDEYAKSLGINVKRVRLMGMTLASLTTAVIVSFYGVISFVGLAVPHIVRQIIGNDEQYLIPASTIGGGIFLLLSDTLARTIISPVILPVGILTSFIGAPLFLALLIRNIKKGYWS